MCLTDVSIVLAAKLGFGAFLLVFLSSFLVIFQQHVRLQQHL